MLNVLVLCTGNSVRSVLGEALITELGAGRFQGFSAGSQPKGAVHPLTLETLSAHGHRDDGYRSQSWDAFAAPGAPVMDVVVTVCDSAAAETCPIWPQRPGQGAPIKTHWGVADPAAVEGDEGARRAAFEHAYQVLRARVEALVALPITTLSRLEFQERLDAIGAVTP